MQQIITLMRLIPSQNYYTFKIYISQKKCLSMASPISSKIAEIFLKPFKYIHIKQLETKTILYTRYLNDIVIIYDSKRTHSDLINTYINQIHTDIKLRHTCENNGCIRFLGLLIILKLSNLETDIFRKPNTTDTTINFLSNHPIEHKVDAVRHYITRMHSLLLTSKKKQME